MMATRTSLLLVLWLVPAVAIAGEAESRKYVDAGKQAYEAGQYLVAAAAYEEAYREAPLPGIVFMLAQSYRRQYYVDGELGHLERALALYRRYLGEVPEGGRRAHAVTHIASIEEVLARAGPHAPAAPAPVITQLMIRSSAKGARARIDDAAATAVPFASEVTPGRHRVRVEASGHLPADAEWLAVEGRLVVAEVELEPQPARLEVRAAAGADVRIDGRSVSNTAELKPGRYELVVGGRGRVPFRRSLELLPGDALTIDAPLRRTRQRTAAHWVFASAGLACVAGVTSVALAMDAQGDAQDILGRRVPGRPLSDMELATYNDELDRRDSYRGASYLLLGGATALAVTGAALWWFDEPSLTPIAAPSYAGATLRKTF